MRRQAGRSRGFLHQLVQPLVALVRLSEEAIEVDHPYLSRGAHRRFFGCEVELFLGAGGLSLSEIERSQRQVGVGGVRLDAGRLLERGLGSGDVRLPELKRAHGQMELGLVGVIGANALEPPHGSVHFPFGGHGAGEDRERVEVLGILLESESRLFAGFLQPAAEYVERRQPHPRIEVVGVELDRPLEVLEGGAELTGVE
jgi:hypothetical protein